MVVKPFRMVRKGDVEVCAAFPVVVLLWVLWYSHDVPHFSGMRFSSGVRLPESWGVVLMVAAYALRRDRPAEARSDQGGRGGGLIATGSTVASTN
jgi:hypothetical protein